MANKAAVEAITRAYRTILSTSSAERDGYSVELVDDSLFRWRVKLDHFDPTCQLFQDLFLYESATGYAWFFVLAFNPPTNLPAMQQIEWMGECYIACIFVILARIRAHRPSLAQTRPCDARGSIPPGLSSQSPILSSGISAIPPVDRYGWQSSLVDATRTRTQTRTRTPSSQATLLSAVRSASKISLVPAGIPSTTSHASSSWCVTRYSKAVRCSTWTISPSTRRLRRKRPSAEWRRHMAGRPNCAPARARPPLAKSSNSSKASRIDSDDA